MLSHFIKLGLFFVFILPSLSYSQWEQIDSTNYGDSESVVFGCSVSMNGEGDVIAVGHVGGDKVIVYENISGEWIQLGGDIIGPSTSFGTFGERVDLNASGNILAVGANFDNYLGRVSIYHLVDDVWELLGNPIEGVSSDFDHAGDDICLSSSDTIIAISASLSGPNNNGAARVYEYTDGDWIQKGQTIYGVSIGDNLRSVSLNSNGSILACGSTGNDTNGSNSGHVRVFGFDGIEWVQMGDNINGQYENNRAGESIDLSAGGNIVAISEPNNHGPGGSWYAGRIRVFEYIDSTWIQLGNNIVGESGYNNLGFSLEISADGQKLVAGAPYSNDVGNFSGRARVFNFCEGNWIQLDNTMVADTSYDNFGFFVALNDDGSKIIIGARAYDAADYNGYFKTFSNCNTMKCFDSFSCYPYESPSSTYLWDETGFYFDTIPNMNGCDSIIGIDLTVYEIDTSVSKYNDTLIANGIETSYQWIKCDSVFTMIEGANDQIFIPDSSGLFAVILSNDKCIDTSSCYYVISSDIGEIQALSEIKIFPNPTSGNINIVGEKINNIKVLDLSGKLIQNRNVDTTNFQANLAILSPGIYFIKVTTTRGVVVKKIILE